MHFWERLSKIQWQRCLTDGSVELEHEKLKYFTSITYRREEVDIFGDPQFAFGVKVRIVLQSWQGLCGWKIRLITYIDHLVMFLGYFS